MRRLDSLILFEKTNKHKIYESIEYFLDQFEEAWNMVGKLELDKKFSEAKNIVIAGMGGSALGGRIVDSLIPDRARVPIEVFTEFKLPYYANKKTLVILSSYSGNTQETLSVANEAINKNCKIIGISTGGKLTELLERQNLAHIKFDPKENPSNQPRMSLGYSISFIIALLSKLEFIHMSEDEINISLQDAKSFCLDFGFKNKSDKNLAKNIAFKLKGKIPVLVGSEHLIGSLHAVKNMMNESSKTFALLFDLPEANHHLMEGLKNPFEGVRNLKFLFFESELYTPDVFKRYSLTKKVVRKNSINAISYKLQSTKRLTQIFETLLLGEFLSFYLSMLYAVDPSTIPWVDYFKKQLLKN